MSFQIYNERPVFPQPTGCVGGFSGFGVIPVIVYAMAGAAVAAGGVVAKWLSSDDWSVGEYNAYMSEMYNTILLWDKVGWQKGCWTDATRRARWVIFMNAFGKHYGAYGKISSASFVSDSEEKPAREFARQLASWGDELNNACSAQIPVVIPNGSQPGANSIDLGSALKWGGLLVGGLIGLQLFTAYKSTVGRFR